MCEIYFCLPAMSLEFCCHISKTHFIGEQFFIVVSFSLYTKLQKYDFLAASFKKCISYDKLFQKNKNNIFNVFFFFLSKRYDLT